MAVNSYVPSGTKMKFFYIRETELKPTLPMRTKQHEVKFIGQIIPDIGDNKKIVHIFYIIFSTTSTPSWTNQGPHTKNYPK